MTKRLSALLLLLSFPLISHARQDIAQLLQLIDYVGVDYPAAVTRGQVIKPGEYEEMLDFSRAIRDQAAALPTAEDGDAIRAHAERLTALVRAKADASEIGALTGAMRRRLIDAFETQAIPSRAPDLSAAGRLFADNCASCHGIDGRGDGPTSASLEPAPTNFQDRQRYRERTLFGLYNTITLGVAGTAMEPFSNLSQAQRWGLAFYVGQLAVTAAERSAGEALWRRGDQARNFARPETLTTQTPAELEAALGPQAMHTAAYLRTQPQLLFHGSDRTPLGFSQGRLAESLAAYTKGDNSRAYQLAVDAYLEGFELVEHSLDAVDPELQRSIETAMTAYRNLIRNRAPAVEVTAKAAAIQGMLQEAETRLDRTTLSPGSAFASALIILLREGLEALLVVAALGAFLVKTGRRDGLPYLYGGLAAALALGGVTWVASSSVIDISGAGRELTEGIAALVAAGLLFYVGFWLHGKTGAAQWKRFIEGNVKKALTRSTLWGLAGLSFIAVYREVLETVLFYQALWIQTDSAGQGMIVSGLLTAAALLTLLAWLILRYSTRLPLRRFFAATSSFMFLLAVVFAGKGVAALQEAGKLPIDPVNLPSLGLLGIYPNIQGLLVQAAMVTLALYMVYRGRQPRTDKRI